MRGGERVLEALCDAYPGSDIFSLFHVPGSVSPAIERHRIVTALPAAVARLPRAALLPLLPLAVRRLRPTGYDAVLSVSHCVSHGARPPGDVRGTRTLSYCLTPMRYAWGMAGEYLGRWAPPAWPMLAALRAWDRRMAQHVTAVAGISEFIRDRIRHAWQRDVEVIYPPVEVARFAGVARAPEDFYLVVSALAPYKRVDVAVRACSQLGRRLLVVGTGPEARNLQKIAGPTVRFLGWQSDATIAELYGRARALLFPGVEDFGIVPVEAMAAGCPVIATAAGGALETVGRLGIMAPAPTIGAFCTAMQQLEREGAIDPDVLRRQAATFDRAIFLERVTAWIAATLGKA